MQKGKINVTALHKLRNEIKKCKKGLYGPEVIIDNLDMLLVNNESYRNKFVAIYPGQDGNIDAIQKILEQDGFKRAAYEEAGIKNLYFKEGIILIIFSSGFLYKKMEMNIKYLKIILKSVNVRAMIRLDEVESICKRQTLLNIFGEEAAKIYLNGGVGDYNFPESFKRLATEPLLKISHGINQQFYRDKLVLAGD